jgi:recombination protein RecT
MENNQLQTVQPTGVKALSSFLNSDSIKNKFTEILGQKGVGFISSVLSIVNGSDQLKDADQNSIYTAALMAASLDLPINQNLGLAYLVPYKTRMADGTYKQVCQFQLGYKGFKQLAQRTGQFVFLNASDVREGELKNFNRLTGGIEFEWNQNNQERLKSKVIGFVSYFELVNGFKSTFYMTIEEVEAHAKKYSQTYKKYGTGLWKDEFHAMAEKTVTKLNLSKNAPLSIEMQRATLADQSVIKNDNFLNEETIDAETEYVDNQETPLEIDLVVETKKRNRVIAHIAKSKDTEELEKCEVDIEPEDSDLWMLFEDKKREFKTKK